jgi:hypothetical protein
MDREIERTARTSDFDSLVRAIIQVQGHLQFQAAKSVNACLTMRNWAIGFYIHEFEQHGRDRATYGKRLLSKLSRRLRQKAIPRTDERELGRYRHFYLVYPQIRETVSPEFQLPRDLAKKSLIRGTLSPQSQHHLQ